MTVHDERRAVTVAARHPRDEAGASGGCVEELRLKPESAEFSLHVLGGLSLSLGLPPAPVHGLEADEVAGDPRSGLEFVVSGHADHATGELCPQRFERSGRGRGA